LLVQPHYSTTCPDKTVSPLPYPQVHPTDIIVKLTAFVRQIDVMKTEVVEFIKEFEQGMKVAIEATPGWYWLYDHLEGEGLDAKLSHPLKTKAIA